VIQQGALLQIVVERRNPAVEGVQFVILVDRFRSLEGADILYSLRPKAATNLQLLG
jgi:hypothetical protein